MGSDIFDVCIIGAGPAGLKCAEVLGRSDKKVLLIEKKGVIGPKPCGGLLPANGAKYLGEGINSVKFPKVQIFLKDKLTELKIEESPIYTISRETLGEFQERKIGQFDNIVFLKNTVVEKIDKDMIRLNNGRVIKYKYLVGADGSAS